MSLIKAGVAGVVGLALIVMSPPASGQGACVAQAVSVSSEGLRLTGVVMRPLGAGPFPVVMYNHSSKAGYEAQPTLEAGTPCFPFVVERGWVYFVLDRRGYGRSEGVPLRDALGSRSGLSLLLATRARYEQEAGDLLAGWRYIRSRLYVAPDRIAAIGYSLGGQILMLAASREPAAFRAIVLQATGSGRYHSLLLREMLVAAADVTAPFLIQHAREDADVPLRFSTDLAEGLRRQGKDVALRLYAGDHMLFASEPRAPRGEWGRELLEFLGRQLR